MAQNSLPILSKASPTRQQLEHQDNDGDHEDEMNQAARNVKAKPKEPKDNQNDDEGIEHSAWGLLSFRNWRWRRV
jgi:hypothetical protein